MLDLAALLKIVLLAQFGHAGVPAPRDSESVHRRAVAAVEEFTGAWRFDWEMSENAIHGAVLGVTPAGLSIHAFTASEFAAIDARWDGYVSGPGSRDQVLHCHPDSNAVAREAGPARSIPSTMSEMRRGASTDAPSVLAVSNYRPIGGHIIPTGIGKRAICPTWSMFEGNPPFDEGVSLDAAIVPALLPDIRKRRAALLDVLATAAKRLPGDSLLVGQWVRFALDQPDLAQAATAAGICTAPRWWCVALTAYVTFQRGNIVTADSLFLAAMTHAPPTDRCAWSDLSVLLEHRPRLQYDALSCAQRDTVNARIWWLSDPLYIEPGNSRRADHYARAMLFALRAGVRLGERWDMTPSGGGNGIREMVIRYGWPSYAWWGGFPTDRSHFLYLNNGEQFYGRFTTAEYSSPRFHTVPAWSAIVDPFHANAEDWILSSSRNALLNPEDTAWWPVEHFRRAAGPLLEITETQTALFRRDSSAAFALATDLHPAQFGESIGDTVQGALIFSTGPTTMRVLPRGGIVGYSAVFRANIDSGPQLVGLELPSKHPLGLAARTRFGVTAPPPLIALRRGAIAMSDIALIRPLENGAPPSTDPAVTLSRMFGSTHLRNQGRLGIYWETYGLRAVDTIEVSIRFEPREPPPSALQRLGTFIGAVSRDGGVMIIWGREPSSDRLVTAIPATVPTLGRTLSIDLAQLAPGPYVVLISVKRPGGAPITSRREFNVVTR